MARNQAKPRTVDASKLSTMAMVAGGEKKRRYVIDDGVLKEWVGFGWISLGKPTKAQVAKYETVVR